MHIIDFSVKAQRRSHHLFSFIVYAIARVSMVGNVLENEKIQVKEFYFFGKFRKNDKSR